MTGAGGDPAAAAGAKRSQSLRLFVPLAIGLAVVLGTGLFAISSATRRSQDSAWVVHTWVVINHVDALRLRTARVEGDLMSDALAATRERASEADSLEAALTRAWKSKGALESAPAAS